VNVNQAVHRVRTMCRVLGVSASGYYDWRDRKPSQRAMENAVLVEQIRQVHDESDGTYGMPRVRAELMDRGVCVARQRIARLMRSHGIRGVSRRRGYVVTTQRAESQRPAPDLVNRAFVAEGPNELWVADMTYVPTWAGFIYLAIVLDVWSRRIVGWSIGEQMTADLVLAALNMALQQRKPDQVIHHSDQGSQYTSVAFGQRCENMGVRPSMGSVGDAYDNAMAESFFARSSASRSTGESGRPRPKPDWPCSRTSRVGTTHGGGTARSVRRRRRPLSSASPTGLEKAIEATTTGYPPAASAWQAPRRPWISLVPRPRPWLSLNHQVKNRPWKWVKSKSRLPSRSKSNSSDCTV
jgi:putative transposase